MAAETQLLQVDPYIERELASHFPAAKPTHTQVLVHLLIPIVVHGIM